MSSTDILNINNEATKKKEDDSEDRSRRQSNWGFNEFLEVIKEKILVSFTNQYKENYAIMRLDGHEEVIRLESNRFKSIVQKICYYECNKQVPSKDLIEKIIELSAAEAQFSGKRIETHVRIAGDDNVIWYDLANNRGESIRVTKDGWNVVPSSGVAFLRYTQKDQVYPDRSYESDIMDEFLKSANVNERDRLLAKVYIISSFIAKIPHPILVLYGDQGSSKSTFLKSVKYLIDPCTPLLLSLHRDGNELVQQLSHNYAAYYDNVKEVPDWLSDELCKAVTGAGQTKRKLYTDDDDKVYEYKRCIALNGINISLTEPDALDRSILIRFSRILQSERLTEAEVTAKFEMLRPKLLGYIFDILVKALQIRDAVKPRELPRMADFALWGEAIAIAMGHKEGDLLDAYNDNMRRINAELVDFDVVGKIIIDFCQRREHQGNIIWEGRTEELLEELGDIAASSGIDTRYQKWPRAANALTKRLEKIAANLSEGFGIKVNTFRDSRQNISKVRIEM